jgi:hypothetical protein
VLDADGLQVPDAGPGHRRNSAAGQEEDAHQRRVAHPLQAVGGDDIAIEAAQSCRGIGDPSGEGYLEHGVGLFE